jgi:hypothetical protein
MALRDNKINKIYVMLQGTLALTHINHSRLECNTINSAQHSTFVMLQGTLAVTHINHSSLERNGINSTQHSPLSHAERHISLNPH